MQLDTDALAALAWSQLWQVTAVIVLVAVLARLARGSFPHLAYGLWMLAVIKCLTPPLWSSPTGVFCWALAREQVASPGTPVARPSQAGANERAKQVTDLRHPTDATSAVCSPIAPARRDWSPTAILLAGWAAITASCAAVVAALRSRCVARLRLKGCAVPAHVSSIVSRLAARLGLRQAIRVLVTGEPIGPAVFGVLRPTLVLPRTLALELPTTQLESIIAHELIHMRRGDLAAGALQILAQILWWFHPLVWLLGRELVQARERCCDEETLASLSDDRAGYAQALLSVIEHKRRLRSAFTFPGIRSFDLTRARLVNIMLRKSSLSRRTSGAQWIALTVLAFVLVPGAGLTRSNRAAANGPAATRIQPGQNDPTVPDEIAGSSADETPGAHTQLQQGPSPMDKELEKLQGTWLIQTLEMDGAVVAGAAGMGAKITIENDKFTTTGMGATYRGTLKIDAKTAPKKLDMAFLEGPERGNSSLAIYELDGDSWKLCLGLTGKDRPTDFATRPGSGHVLETLARQAAGKAATPTKPAGPDRGSAATTKQQELPAGDFLSDPKELERLQGEWTGVTLVLSGETLPAQFLKGAKRIVKGNETTVIIGGQTMMKAMFVVNSSVTPKTIDYTITDGADQGKKQLGIYEIEGDIAKYCFGAVGKDRPTTFESKPGDGRTYGTWKRPGK
jgi:uncharacterized protein (TIGR03067 family)